MTLPTNLASRLGQDMASRSLPCGAEKGPLPPGAEPSAARWTQAAAIELCRLVEAICPEFGCHVALTGGCLYRDGERKDADILFYRIRQVEEIDKIGLFGALAEIGLREVRGFGWCHKAEFQGLPVDCFFPDEDGDYPPKPEPDPDHLRDLKIEDERPF